MGEMGMGLRFKTHQMNFNFPSHPLRRVEKTPAMPKVGRIIKSRQPVADGLNAAWLGKLYRITNERQPLSVHC